MPNRNGKAVKAWAVWLIPGELPVLFDSEEKAGQFIIVMRDAGQLVAFYRKGLIEYRELLPPLPPRRRRGKS